MNQVLYSSALDHLRLAYGYAVRAYGVGVQCRRSRCTCRLDSCALGLWLWLVRESELELGHELLRLAQPLQVMLVALGTRGSGRTRGANRHRRSLLLLV